MAIIGGIDTSTFNIETKKGWMSQVYYLIYRMRDDVREYWTADKRDIDEFSVLSDRAFPVIGLKVAERMLMQPELKDCEICTVRTVYNF